MLGLLAAALFAAAAVGDALWRRIPNALVIGLFGLYALMSLTAGLPLKSMAVSMALATIAFVCLALCFLRGWLGGGDVKLGAALSLWIGGAGLEWLGPTLFVVGACSLLLALVGMAVDALLARRIPVAGLALLSARRGVPFGVGLGAAGIMVGFAAASVHWPW